MPISKNKLNSKTICDFSYSVVVELRNFYLDRGKFPGLAGAEHLHKLAITRGAVSPDAECFMFLRLLSDFALQNCIEAIEVTVNG